MATGSSNMQFVDGSLGADLPITRMGELFNINTYIVSQVNPHVSRRRRRRSAQVDQQNTRVVKMRHRRELCVREGGFATVKWQIRAIKHDFFGTCARASVIGGQIGPNDACCSDTTA